MYKYIIKIHYFPNLQFLHFWILYWPMHLAHLKIYEQYSDTLKHSFAMFKQYQLINSYKSKT